MTQQNRGLLPGTVDLVILQTLTQGPLHGFAVSRSIRARSEGILELQDAALYQALHRMEKSGWIEAEWYGAAGVRDELLAEVRRGRLQGARAREGGGLAHRGPGLQAGIPPEPLLGA